MYVEDMNLKSIDILLFLNMLKICNTLKENILVTKMSNIISVSIT